MSENRRPQGGLFLTHTVLSTQNLTTVTLYTIIFLSLK